MLVVSNTVVRAEEAAASYDRMLVCFTCLLFEHP